MNEIRINPVDKPLDKPLDKPATPARAETREVLELRQLKEDQPDLASAIDLQIQLLQMQRRVQSRVPLPSINLDAAHLDKAVATGKPILAFEQVPIDWSDLRFLVRSTADAMRTHEAIESEDYRRIEALSKDAEFLRPAVRNWYEASRPVPSGGQAAGPEIAGLEPLLLQAMRPFLSRCADAIMARTVFQGWPHGSCPLCGGEPDFSVITPAALRVEADLSVPGEEAAEVPAAEGEEVPEEEGAAEAAAEGGESPAEAPEEGGES